MSASASSEPEFTAVPGVLPEIRALIESARRRVVSTANLEMVVLYWNIGRIIARDGGRATHGKQLVERLAVHLARQYGRGFSSANLWAMRRFYDAFLIPQTVSAELAIGPVLLAPEGENADDERITLNFEQHAHLGWSHYILLLRERDSRRLRFYFEQAAMQRWSVRELNRQTDAALYERVALSKNTAKLAAIEKKGS